MGRLTDFYNNLPDPQRGQLSEFYDACDRQGLADKPDWVRRDVERALGQVVDGASGEASLIVDGSIVAPEPAGAAVRAEMGA